MGFQLIHKGLFVCALYRSIYISAEESSQTNAHESRENRLVSFDEQGMMEQIYCQFGGDPEGFELALQGIEIMKYHWEDMAAAIEDGRSTLIASQMAGVSSNDILLEDMGEFIPFKVEDSKIHLSRIASNYMNRNPGSLYDFTQLVLLVQSSGKGAQIIEDFETAKERLASSDAPALVPSGFIFHMSHCGSTLICDMLSVDSGNLVYYEPSFLEEALIDCVDCSFDEQVELVRLLVGLLGKSSSHQRMFIKFQPHMTWYLKVIQQAFPETPWIFLYRNPVEVLVSLLHSKEALKHAEGISENIEKVGGAFGMSKEPYCLSKALIGGNQYDRKVLSLVYKVHQNPTKEDLCAAYLSSVMEPVLEELMRDDVSGKGKAVPYHAHLADWMLNYILPLHFQVDIPDAEIKDAMKNISKVRTKGRKTQREEIYEDDSGEKHERAWKELKDSAEDYLSLQFQNFLRKVPL